MRFKEARAILRYWENAPPLNEVLSVLAQAYTTWRPEGMRPKNEEEALEMQRQSREARWNAGAIRPEQIVAALLQQKGRPMTIGGDGIGVMPGVH